MTKQRIIQFVAGLSLADAISNEAIKLREIFRNWGYPSDIVCPDNRVLPELRNEIIPQEQYKTTATDKDIVLLHFSIGSSMNEFFTEVPGRKALLYHNITPSEYLRGIHPGMAKDLEMGRRQLLALIEKTEVLMAVSKFNACELDPYNKNNVHVLPLVLDWNQLNRDIDHQALKTWQDGFKNILFVGRCVPHKKIEDILFSFHFYQKYIQPQSRLIYIGSSAGTEKYLYWLQTLVRKNSIKNVEFPGAVPQPALNAAFKAADLFLCMSEHEGFCIPLIEAMEHDIPIMAYAAGAVPETLDGAGILVHQKKYDVIAEMMNRIITDDSFRSSILSEQRKRLDRYKKEDLEARLHEYLAPLITT